jgi:hypothetical protein
VVASSLLLEAGVPPVCVGVTTGEGGPTAGEVVVELVEVAELVVLVVVLV